MIIGTDFSGIGAPEQALTNLGIKYKTAFACEIDKHARKSYEAIHGRPVDFYNDITKRDHKETEKVNLYFAGFPCQSFSLAGKRLGFNEVRGTLFFNVAEYIKTTRPECFVLENVKGLINHDNGKTFKTIISLLSDNGGTVNGQISIPYFNDGLGYHLYYSVLNSKNYGVPQNRERIFIIGFKNFRSFNFPKPEPLTKKLIDVIDKNVNKKYFLSEKGKKYVTNPKRLKKKFTQINNDIALTLMAEGQKNWTGDFIKYKDNKIIVSEATKQGFSIASVGDSINLDFPNSQTRRGRVGKQISQTLITGCNIAVINSADQIRRLTPRECFRLQGFKDSQYKKAAGVCSDKQLYKQAGNSITVDVLEKIIKKILYID
jgi:DNA (cytosine-5)-methyltransferase 1